MLLHFKKVMNLYLLLFCCIILCAQLSTFAKMTCYTNIADCPNNSAFDPKTEVNNVLENADLPAECANQIHPVEISEQCTRATESYLKSCHDTNLRLAKICGIKEPVVTHLMDNEKRLQLGMQLSPPPQKIISSSKISFAAIVKRLMKSCTVNKYNQCVWKP